MASNFQYVLGFFHAFNSIIKQGDLLCLFYSFIKYIDVIKHKMCQDISALEKKMAI